ncbi:site-specific DNA-methyltransferase [Erythrobacter aurantius]|uniref:site-specific DNA-methyltransferase n=1 Tax=Erythrobacter aurantius TaxID=2909249 RepID=UPI0020794DA3|nr:DNA methyltransferase [Erythrobacter aurantius]
MKLKDHPKKTPHGSHQPANKSKLLANKLKAQLQKKSRARRDRHAAASSVASAATFHGRNDLQPDLQLVEKPIEALRPSPDRARITTPQQLEGVIKSIKRLGLVLPVLIDGSDTIVSGHVIWEAASKLGFETISCIVIEHLDETELKALSLALNRMAETGGWDLELLREQMIAIESAGIELTTTGFTLPEIDQILIVSEPFEEEEEPEEGETAEGDINTVSREADLFQLGDHRLLCGDALIAASYELLLEGFLAHCVFSDPPYNCPIDGFVSGLGQHKHENFAMAVGEMDQEAFRDFLKTYLAHCKSYTSEGAITFACMDWRQIEQLLLAADDAGLKRTNVAVWNKGSGGMGGIYRSAHEFIAVLCNGKTPATNNVELGRHGRDRTNVWSYPGANRRGSSSCKALADHPTPKPIELVEDALLDVSNRGEIVLDPFLGSGTTMIAAERVGRICCGIELDPKYVDRAIRRWEAFTGEHAIHVATGMTFEELGHARASAQEDSHD